MRLLKSLAVAAVCCLGLMLAGCSSSTSTADLTKIDQTIGSQNVQTGIQFACLALSGAEAGWNAWTASHDVGSENIQNANAAIAGVSALCATPYPQNTSDAVAKVVAASVAVLTALHSEQGGEVASASQ